MLALVIWGSYLSEHKICNLELNPKEGKEKGYRNFKNYYSINEEIYTFSNQWISNIKIEEILGKDFSIWNSVGITNLDQSYVFPITREKSDKLIQVYENEIYKNLEALKNRIENYYFCPIEKQNEERAEILNCIENLDSNKNEMYELFLKVVRKFNDDKLKLAIKNNKNELLSIRTVPCNKEEEDCSCDYIYEYITPNNEVIEHREHSF